MTFDQIWFPPTPDTSSSALRLKVVLHTEGLEANQILQQSSKMPIHKVVARSVYDSRGEFLHLPTCLISVNHI